MTEAQAEEILATHYGLQARATSLGSQQDKNFVVTGIDDEAGEIIGVLKIANPVFNATEIEAQDLAAERIAEAEPTLRIAVPLPNLAGENVHGHNGFDRGHGLCPAAALPARRDAAGVGLLVADGGRGVGSRWRAG